MKNTSFLENNSMKMQLYPTSYSQASMYFIYKIDPEGVGYNVMFATKINAELNLDALEKSFNHLVHKHPTLRTVFLEAGSKIYQRLLSENYCHFQKFDASSMTDSEIQLEMEAFGHQPYDLQKGPLFRVGVFSKNNTEHFMMIGMHHITCDAGSFETIFKDLQLFYDCAVNSTVPDYTPLNTFNQFVKWEREWLKTESASKAKEYWKQQLQTSPPRIDLKKLSKAGDSLNDFMPTRGSNFNFEGGEYFYNFDPELTHKLKELAKRERVTLYNLLTSVYFLLLHKFTDNTDVTIGSYANLRHHHKFEKQVGYYLNTIVLRADIIPEQSFNTFLHQTKENLLHALSHQYYPFVLLAEELKPAREPGRQLWFDHILNWTTGENYEMSNSYFMDTEPKGDIENHPLPMQPWKINRRTAPFDLALNMGELNGQIACSIFYNSLLFDTESVSVLMHRYKTLLEQVVEHPQTVISKLSLLDEQEQNTILKEWTNNKLPYDEQLTLHEAFIKTAASNPNSTAISCGNENLTYAQLNELSEQVGETLKKSGVKKGMSVGICIERSPILIVGLFAILRIGANYVPLDPAYPKDRNDYMLDDSEADYLLTTSKVRESYSPTTVNSIVINPDYEASLLEMKPHRERQSVKEAETAYLIYTSGSSGKPKGTKVSHKNCAALFHWADLTFLDNEMKGVLASTSICFDISVFEIFYPLTRGGKIILTEDLLHLLEDTNKDEVTLINTVPSVISALIDGGEFLRMSKSSHW
jgi:non-ribosomal peptide synthetase component F